jgi:hypothetical protein
MEIAEGMADIGMMLEDTDHLSDAELYRYLVDDALLVETMVSPAAGHWHLSPIGGGSEEDNEIYLRYYADDEYREACLDSVMRCRRRRSRRTIATGFAGAWAGGVVRSYRLSVVGIPVKSRCLADRGRDASPAGETPALVMRLRCGCLSIL